MALEREIKLRFDTVGDARARVRDLGATPLHERRLQEDVLLDAADHRLARARSTLRVRQEPSGARLTFKGPPLPGTLKIREEHETTVGDAAVLMAVLEGLGFSVRFRCQKYREEFAAGGAVIAIDETPVGVFVEVEGPERDVHAVAAGLGRLPADYITASYQAIFLAHRDAHGGADTDMVFTPAPTDR